MDLGISKENEKGGRGVGLLEKKSFIMYMMNLRMSYLSRDFRRHLEVGV